MRIILLSLVFVATTAVAAHARVGETPDQLVARYGQPINEVDQKAEGDKIALAHVSFQKGGFQIDVTISGGLSVEEVFKKLNGQSITVDEAHILLTDNAQGQNWGFPTKGKDSITWSRDDHATAKLGSDGMMTIRSPDLVAQEAAAKHLEQRPTLEGF